MTLADMTRAERSQWVRENGDYIARERLIFEAAVERYGHAIDRTNANEYGGFTPDSFKESVMEHADKKLAEEVREHLGV